MKIEITGNECIGYGVDIIENGVRHNVIHKRHAYSGKGTHVYACGKLENIQKVKAKAELLKEQGFDAEYIATHVIGYQL